MQRRLLLIVGPSRGAQSIYCALHVVAQEVFTALLICPVANLGRSMANRPKKCDITIADILGPLEGGKPAIRARDANFSLPTYSYSLVGLGSEFELRAAWKARRRMCGRRGLRSL